YGMARGEIYVNPSITTVDEQAVVEGLMADHPRILGDPFLPTSYRPQESSSITDYRLQWMGLQFSLLKPGEAGTGLRVPFDGSDFGAPRTVSPDYVIGGR
ncbi:MAG: hypothetical protein KDK99_21380, partial [Verrucomicrobiales bacterium]|nr:hypothetical protein [Verrucomicrobiales bacterium]